MSVPSSMSCLVALPKDFIQKGYKQAIINAINGICLDKLEKDPKRMTFLYNKEEEDTKRLLSEYAEKYPGITLREQAPDFAKHKRQAYIKRNKTAFIRASHVLVIYDKPMTLTQESLINMAEEGTSRFVLSLMLDEKDVENA